MTFFFPAVEVQIPEVRRSTAFSGLAHPLKMDFMGLFVFYARHGCVTLTNVSLAADYVLLGRRDLVQEPLLTTAHDDDMEVVSSCHHYLVQVMEDLMRGGSNRGPLVLLSYCVSVLLPCQCLVTDHLVFSCCPVGNIRPWAYVDGESHPTMLQCMSD